MLNTSTLLERPMHAPLPIRIDLSQGEKAKQVIFESLSWPREVQEGRKREKISFLLIRPPSPDSL